MDKSPYYQKGIVRLRGFRFFITTLLLLLFFVFFAPLTTLFLDESTGCHAFAEEIASFHIKAKDLNLLDFEPLLNKYLGDIECEGVVSLEADIKLGDGVIIAVGEFSSKQLTVSYESSSLPLDFSGIEGTFDAKLADKTPEIKGKVNSQQVEFRRLVFKNLQAGYCLSGNKLNINESKAELGNGAVNLDGDVDFSEKPYSFDISFTTEGINIKNIAERWGASKPISGMLFLDGELSGKSGKPTTYSGKANVQIKEGDLGEIGLIGRLITFSPLATLGKDLPLTTMEGDFNISEGYASTGNTVIKGPDVRIVAKGDVGWNRKLDFILSLYASSEQMKGTPITKILGAIIDTSGNILRQIKLTGTIDNPDFTIIPLGIGSVIKRSFEESFNNSPPVTDSP
jgi:hypothetical protein